MAASIKIRLRPSNINVIQTINSKIKLLVRFMLSFFPRKCHHFVFLHLQSYSFHLLHQQFVLLFFFLQSRLNVLLPKVMFSLLLHQLLTHPCESLSQVFPTEVSSKLASLLLDGALHIIYMHSLATNKSVAQQQSVPRLSQPDLHAKILNLVANRMQPTSSALLLQKQSCGSCVAPSPAATKRNSLAATRMKDKQSRVNQTVCNGSSPHAHENLTKKSGGSTSNLTK